MKASAVLLVVLAILLVASSPGCDKSTKPAPVGAKVEFVRWSAICGGDGYNAVGWVKNTGNRKALNVTVRSSVTGRTLISATSPFDLNPGQEGSFPGPCSSGGSVQAPTIDWIHWD